MSVARGTAFDDLFASLTERMGVIHTATPYTDPSQRDRVEWKNNGMSVVRRGYRRQDQAFTAFLAVAYLVSVYGATEFEVTTRTGDLVANLDMLVGPEQGAPRAGDGYLFGKSTPVVGGNGAAAGFATTIPVTLYLPIYQMVLGSATVAASVNLRTTVLKPDGTTPTADTLNPLVSAA